MASIEDEKVKNSEEQRLKDEAIDKSKKELQADAKGLWQSSRRFLVELLDFRNDTDRDETIEAIKNDIPFKGATAWILICSIFVASVGLNANSTAVVIGAMLISPLMGPILGVGLSLAVNDIDTLKKSLINLATMIVLSLLTAFLFFWLFPLSQDTSELLGRTKPDIRDVLIAFFGGLALIIARTKRGTIASVIFGVAIATALMPPLCTVGYGLAIAISEDPVKGRDIAIGAMYLFAINTIFIALATFLVLKLLRFPMRKYANSAKRKRIARFASLLAFVVMIPAGITFYKVLKESNFENAAKRFIDKELSDKDFKNISFVKRNAEYHYSKKEGESYIQLYVFDPEVDTDVIKNRLDRVIETNDRYGALKGVNIKLPKNGDKSDKNDLNVSKIWDLYNEEKTATGAEISELKREIKEMEALKANQIPIDKIEKTLYSFQSVDSFTFVVETRSNFKKADTLHIFNIRWNDSLSPKERTDARMRLESILINNFNQKKIVVRNLN